VVLGLMMWMRMGWKIAFLEVATKIEVFNALIRD